jgi:ferredoxin/flavodoxin---NADP+ reductase
MSGAGGSEAQKLGTERCPLRVAIVGSGPSGFYAADALFKSGRHVTIDMFDRLPTPYGLVRLGVAPDHQKIKSSIRVYEKIAQNPGFAFWGNVKVGRDVLVDELRQFYDALIFAVGAETDRRLNIPGEDLPGSHTATEFVGWYNGHPDYRNRQFDFNTKAAVIIGQGNVAVDVCRILAKTVDELKSTDIVEYALDALAESKIRNIYMVGRRGPAQAKFTQQEVKELGRLAECDPIVDPADMELDPLSRQEADHPDNHHALRILPELQGFAKRPTPTKPKRLHFCFLRSPAEILGAGRVEKILLEKNELTGEPFNLNARGTGELEELPCGLVFRSVGYVGVPMPGLPFDERRGTIYNIDGRVVDKDLPIPGIYVAGWIKRGASGVIGTNKPDSASTVQALLDDLPSLPPSPNRSTQKLEKLLSDRNIKVISFPDWVKIDQAEQELGRTIGKPGKNSRKSRI